MDMGNYHTITLSQNDQFKYLSEPHNNKSNIGLSVQIHRTHIQNLNGLEGMKWYCVFVVFIFIRNQIFKIIKFKLRGSNRQHVTHVMLLAAAAADAVQPLKSE